MSFSQPIQKNQDLRLLAEIVELSRIMVFELSVQPNHGRQFQVQGLERHLVLLLIQISLVLVASLDHGKTFVGVDLAVLKEFLEILIAERLGGCENRCCFVVDQAELQVMAEGIHDQPLL